MEKETFMTTVDYTQPQTSPQFQQQPPSWWSRNWKWVVLVGCLLPLLLCGGGVAGLVFVVFKAMRSTEVYTQAVSRATNNAEVRERLGEPIVPKWWMSGNIENKNGEGTANLMIPIAGPKGEGKIRAVAYERNDRWIYERLEVEIGSDTINLLDSSPSPPESTDTSPPGA
jgi:hypothetical protein